MKFFIDSGDMDHIRFWMDAGIGSGITTNPIIMKKSGVADVNSRLKKIVEYMEEKPVSIQVTKSAPQTVYAEAKNYARFGENVVIKVPIVTPTGESALPVINRLAQEGYKVNATTCLKATQAIMAAMAGARYVSLFYGRISDQGGDPLHQIKLVREWLDQSGLDTEIIVGSIRSVDAVCMSLSSRPHICTITPEVLSKCTEHAMSQQTAAEFEAAAEVYK